MSAIVVVTTVGTVDDARGLARELVEQQLAACAQISAIESFYRWDGALQHDPEWRVLFKTTGERYAELEAAIRERHPYQLPAIHAFEMAQAYAPYAEWIAHESRPVR